MQALLTSYNDKVAQTAGLIKENEVKLLLSDSPGSKLVAEEPPSLRKAH